MSKTSKAAEGTEFPTFDASKTTEQLRSFAEKTAEQTKEAYERAKDSAEEARKALEASLETAKSVGDRLVLKSIAAMRAGAEANFNQFEALVNAKSFSEVIELQSVFLRKQMELAVDQARDFQAISQEAATEVTKPMRNVFEKVLKQATAA